MYKGKPWWVFGQQPYTAPNPPHGEEQFQVWFNDNQWRLGYTSNYWFVNNNPGDMGGNTWIPGERITPTCPGPVQISTAAMLLETAANGTNATHGLHGVHTTRGLMGPPAGAAAEVCPPDCVTPFCGDGPRVKPVCPVGCTVADVTCAAEDDYYYYYDPSMSGGIEETYGPPPR
jgi:hypothetical protein